MPASTPANPHGRLACGVAPPSSSETVCVKASLIDRPGRRSFWVRLLIGAAVGGGLHTLCIAIVGMVPRSGDDLDLWSMYFVVVSAVPVFVTVVIGLILASQRSRLAPLGGGLVAGALVSPLLWLVSGSG